MHQLKLLNINRIQVGHLNISSLQNKFEVYKKIVKSRLDLKMVSKTKLDDSFPEGQFEIDDYSTYKKDGMITLLREDIPSKLISFSIIDKNIKHFFVEINLRNRKWLISCSNNHLTKVIGQHLHHLGKGLVYLMITFFWETLMLKLQILLYVAFVSVSI